MNPSTSGWLKKMLAEQHQYFETSEDEADIYYQLREVGFIYGANPLPLSKTRNVHFKLSQLELAKVNLAQALIKTYGLGSDKDIEHCFEPMLAFYQLLKKEDKFTFKVNFRRSTDAIKLENIMHQRVQPNINILQKQFSKMITNVLLYIDVLAFKRYLSDEPDVCDFVTRYENLIINLIYLNLQRKSISERSGEMIIQVFANSLRYNSIKIEDCVSLDKMDLSFLRSPMERQYAFDIFLFSVFIDKDISSNEHALVREVGVKLGISGDLRDRSAVELRQFIDQHSKVISFHRSSNPLKNFYSNTYQRISRLVYRNRSRLIREIKADRQLYRLLTLSIHRELDETEKKQVNKQLREILRSIPSLAIFALPGGGILLPLIIQLIPKLLPHSFDENRDEH